MRVFRPTQSLENTFLVSQRKSAVILGAQWGDEGKGKIVDVLSERFSVVARYAGGHNAGHTVIIGGKKFVLQLVPCGTNFLRSEEHTSELQSRRDLVCRLLLEKKKIYTAGRL